MGKSREGPGDGKRDLPAVYVSDLAGGGREINRDADLHRSHLFRLATS
jgi:hypothetical protein